MKALGRHILVEFFGANSDSLNEVSVIENGMVSAAKKAGATVINSTFHHFSPYGVSGVVVIQESHLAIHTWPEFGYAAVDLFTCGDEVNPWVSFDYLKEVLGASNYSAIEMRRGAIDQLERVNFDLNKLRDTAQQSYLNPKEYSRDVWFTDRDENQALSLRYTGDVLFRKESPYQRVSVLDTYAYGKMLTIDNMVMCTERDEFHYHEMMVHPVFTTFPTAKNILVIGGGDGGTIREIVKHDSVVKVTMVEIDEEVIIASKEFLPQLACAFNHPKVDLRIEDGIAYVNNYTGDAFDIIIVDGSDPTGPAEGLFSESFYQNCYNILSKDGILVTQGESPMFHTKAFSELNNCLKTIFPKVNTQLFYAPTYPSGMWSIQSAMKGELDISTPNTKYQEEFIDNNHLHYYNDAIHCASFALPNFVKKLVSE